MNYEKRIVENWLKKALLNKITTLNTRTNIIFLSSNDINNNAVAKRNSKHKRALFYVLHECLVFNTASNGSFDVAH